jgi:hypothetical protein
MSLMTSEEFDAQADALMVRIAEKLGWPLADVHSMSLQSLREAIKPYPKLDHELSILIQTGAVIISNQPKPGSTA